MSSEHANQQNSLQSPSFVLSQRKPDTHEILNFAFQLVGLAAAIIFGVWSVRAYEASVEANRLSAQSLNAATTANAQSVLANQLAMYSFCSQSDSNLNIQDAKLNHTCSVVRANFDPLRIACSLFGRNIDPDGCVSSPSSTPTATTISATAVPTSTYSPPNTSAPPTSSSSPHSVRLSLSIIIPIVIVVVAVVGILLYFFFLRQEHEQPVSLNKEG
ncbi:hypothetical protein DL96DRAFT_1600879 [Flagelloscypha sp. PMI_526]|nr:hypothetical protein DL96DRAFT_1600879 [Flagelloscypha sp. PMI_526]